MWANKFENFGFPKFGAFVFEIFAFQNFGQKIEIFAFQNLGQQKLEQQILKFLLLKTLGKQLFLFFQNSKHFE